jgi:hypothetical protein
MKKIIKEWSNDWKEYFELRKDKEFNKEVELIRKKTKKPREVAKN